MCAIRKQLHSLELVGVVVFGEGERDAAHRLYLGFVVGSGVGPVVHFALAQLDGKRLTAMDMSPAERVNALASAKGCSTEDITVCVLERPRHEDMIAEIRTTGAAIRLITDGDVAGVIHCAEASTGIDMYMGSGGAPEGVLAAAALKCMGGQMFGRLTFRNDDERARAKKAGITNLDRVYTRDDMVTGDVIFAATGVTDGSILPGIKREPGFLTAETILMRSKTGSVRRMNYRNPTNT